MLALALPACRRTSLLRTLAGVAVRGRGGGAMPRKGKAQSKDIVKPPVPSGPVATDKSGSVTISVHAKPGSKLNAVTDLTTEAVSVAIAAPPSEGEANAELCRYLSKVLGVKKSEVVLEKKPTARRPSSQLTVKASAAVSSRGLVRSV
ncbi:UPF0235 protein C15orf40 homolog isoform X2 [Hemicordylus capensis]|uniref:UPF0235 protein C15orf40 homolog isoform X2 n=1 Tax=Hemicordylus capensis TaxID=884348 RepID=UPI002303516F|nr:UPF0235 protein C15orf40 homolog isoform X2 [Hemicordylus capensis]